MVKMSQLHRFVTVVESGSINKAAEQLFISQPTLSASMKLLEDEVGRTLLLRHKQGVTLTREGEVLYQYSKSVLKKLTLIEELKDQDNSVQTARINISAYSILLKPELFAEFTQECRSQEVSLGIDEVTIEQLIENLYEDKSELGLAIINDVELPVIKSIAAARKLKLEVLDSGPLCIHVGPNCSLYDIKDITIEDMKKTRYMHQPFDTYSVLRGSVTVSGGALSEITNILTVNNYPMMAGMLKHLDCFSLGNIWQANELKKYHVRTKKISDNESQMHFVLMSNERKKFVAPEVEMFIDLVNKHYLGTVPDVEE